MQRNWLQVKSLSGRMLVYSRESSLLQRVRKVSWAYTRVSVLAWSTLSVLVSRQGSDAEIDVEVFRTHSGIQTTCGVKEEATSFNEGKRSLQMMINLACWKTRIYSYFKEAGGGSSSLSQRVDWPERFVIDYLVS